MKHHLTGIWAGILMASLVAGGTALALAGDPVRTAPATATPSPASPGVITYRVEDRLYRIAAQEGVVLEDLTAALEALAPGGEDGWSNVSPDGAWLVFSTGRFDPDCAGWPCLVIAPADLSAAETVRVEGAPLHADFSAVASGGDLIVYAGGDGGPHVIDLWAITRRAEGWSAPLLLTAESPYAWNHQPAISEDGSRVVFDCGDEPYGAEGTSLCEVGTGGSDFRVVLESGASPPGTPPGGALHHADYAPDGSIVFEAYWGGVEMIWRLPPEGQAPAPVAAVFTNDNSPCVLADGRIVSLWLGRAGNQPGYHEIKVMRPDGSAYHTLLTGVDVLDAGLGCGG